MGEAIAFYTVAALILGFAVLVVSARSTVYSVLFLVANFLCIAVLYIVLYAEFLAVIQVLVYAGGIVVLYLFVVMLVRLKHPEAHLDVNRRDRTGILLAGVVLAELVAIGFYSFGRSPMPGPASGAARGGGAEAMNVNQIGQLLYVDYLVPFEVASILLLVAMVGAIILARREL
jgi:NADH-quinone oxidoreductase subunit J